MLSSELRGWATALLVVHDLSVGAAIVFAFVFGLLEFLEPTPMVRLFRRVRSVGSSIEAAADAVGDLVPRARNVRVIFVVAYVTGSAVVGMLSDELKELIPSGAHVGWYVKVIGLLVTAVILGVSERWLQRREAARP